MKEVSGLSLVANGTTYFEDGSKVVALDQWKKTRRKAGNTALHETKHSFVQEVLIPHSVQEASIVPGPGYLGITKVSRVHEAAAAAPDADGMSGTHGDRRIIELMRGNLGAASSVARSIMAGKEEVIYETACDLQERGTMSGDEIRSSIYQAEHGREIVLFISTAQGKQQMLTQDASEIIHFPTPIVDFAQAA